MLMIWTAEPDPSPRRRSASSEAGPRRLKSQELQTLQTIAHSPSSRRWTIRLRDPCGMSEDSDPVLGTEHGDLQRFMYPDCLPIRVRDLRVTGRKAVDCARTGNERCRFAGCF